MLEGGADGMNRVTAILHPTPVHTTTGYGSAISLAMLTGN